MVYVISFTWATCVELRIRITQYCAGGEMEESVGQVRISRMHSLALTILKNANLLRGHYPSDPLVLDD